MIEFDHVSVTFQNRGKKFLAVSDVTLTVETGEFFGIVGPSGAGKSTLVRTVNRLQRTDSGSIRIDGREITGLKGRALREERLKIGMIFQHFNLIMNADVGRNIEFALLAAGVSGRKTEERTKELLALVGMSEKLHAYPAELSGGQKQRVSIAGVLAMHPKCIVLDEPTAMLDPSGRKEVIRAVRGLNQVEGVTLILITHYMEEIIHADKVFVMDEGKIAMQGTPREIFSQVEQLKKLRLDVPQVTLLSYELQKRGIPLPDGILTREELVSALGYGKTDRK